MESYVQYAVITRLPSGTGIETLFTSPSKRRVMRVLKKLREMDPAGGYDWDEHGVISGNNNDPNEEYISPTIEGMIEDDRFFNDGTNIEVKYTYDLLHEVK